jgi:hypothetical protein
MAQKDAAGGNRQHPSTPTYNTRDGADKCRPWERADAFKSNLKPTGRSRIRAENKGSGAGGINWFDASEHERRINVKASDEQLSVLWASVDRVGCRAALAGVVGRRERTTR